MEAIRGTWSIGGIALGPIRICPRMGRTDTARADIVHGGGAEPL